MTCKGETGRHPPNFPVRRQVCENTVIPAQAGIQTKDVNLVSLAPRLRGGDGKTELVDGLGA